MAAQCGHTRCMRLIAHFDMRQIELECHHAPIPDPIPGLYFQQQAGVEACLPAREVWQQL